jgi:hypothetical protein
MRKTSKSHIRKIQQSKGSYFISLPINLIRKLGWREKQKLTVTKRGKKLSVKDWEK